MTNHVRSRYRLRTVFESTEMLTKRGITFNEVSLFSEGVARAGNREQITDLQD